MQSNIIIIYLSYFHLYCGMIFLTVNVCCAFLLSVFCEILDLRAQPGLHCMESVCTVQTDLTRLSGIMIY